MKQCRCERCMKKNRYEEEKKWYPEYEEKGHRKERNHHEEEKNWYPEYEEKEYRKERGCHKEEKKWYPEYEEKECDKEHDHDKDHEKECDKGYETIYERPIYCLSEKHFHHRVRHIVPIVYKKIENHHTHHEYIIKKEFKREHKEHEHGKKENVDWCDIEFDKDCHKPGKDCECK